VNQTVMESSISRSDVRKSKSKVRTYLKRCKDALYGHSSDETCTITVNEDLPQSSNTSWYLTTAAMESNDSTNKADSDQLPKAMKTNQVDEQEAIDKEIKCMSMTEVLPLVESQVNKVRGGKICKAFCVFLLLCLSTRAQSENKISRVKSAGSDRSHRDPSKADIV
jgi:hypothetical protein